MMPLSRKERSFRHSSISRYITGEGKETFIMDSCELPLNAFWLDGTSRRRELQITDTCYNLVITRVKPNTNKQSRE
jgi:hypothetical protein